MNYLWPVGNFRILSRWWNYLFSRCRRFCIYIRYSITFLWYLIINLIQLFIHLNKWFLLIDFHILWSYCHSCHFRVTCLGCPNVVECLRIVVKVSNGALPFSHILSRDYDVVVRFNIIIISRCLFL